MSGKLNDEKQEAVIASFRRFGNRNGIFIPLTQFLVKTNANPAHP